jgi:NTP pyrophosphatase (non-canonical NTP hydrolase)
MDVAEMDLAQMEAEVALYCEEMGWREQDSPFAQSMALLHEEIAEAGSAWRKYGLEDMTQELRGYQHGLPKPEGVGSEFADIFIRLLDDSHLYGLKLPGMFPRIAEDGWYAFDDNFMVNINTLHGLVARASMEFESNGVLEYAADNLGGVLKFLDQLCRLYGIDLMAEYTRKMAYNKTRERRHGGKRC